MIYVVEGDLLKATVGIIGHQVNCRGVMGSGLAKQIKEKWPEVYDEYYWFYHENKSNLLGKCQIVYTENIIIANLFGQATFGPPGKLYTDYKSLYKALTILRDYAEVHKLTVGLPYKIGCDRGGGDWTTIYCFLLELFNDTNLLTLYKWKC